MGRTATPSEQAQQFGKRLKAARTKLGLTQEQVAESAGLHFTYVSSVERGERNVTLMSIVRLAAAVNVDPASLVKGLTP